MIFIAIIMTSFASLMQQNESYEQIAVNYFIDTIWPLEFDEYSTIEFSHLTDTSSYMENQIFACGKWDNNTKNHFIEAKRTDLVEITINDYDLKTRKISNSKRLKFHVAPYRKVGKSVMVQMYVYKRRQFVNHYFFKISLDGKILDVCSHDEVI